MTDMAERELASSSSDCFCFGYGACDPSSLDASVRWMSCSGLTQLPAVSYLTALTRMDFYGSEIASLPAGLTTLTNLNSL